MDMITESNYLQLCGTPDLLNEVARRRLPGTLALPVTGMAPVVYLDSSGKLV